MIHPPFWEKLDNSIGEFGNLVYELFVYDLKKYCRHLILNTVTFKNFEVSLKK